MLRMAWVLSLYTLLLSTASGQAQPNEVDALEYFRQEYPIAFRRQADVYLKGTYVCHLTWPRFGPLSEKYSLVRLHLRWPLLRMDWLEPSQPSVVRSSVLITRDMRYGVRRLDPGGSYVLTKKTPAPWAGSDVWQGELANGWAGKAVNQGLLPLVPLSFIGHPLDEFLLRSPDVRIVRGTWTEIYGYKAVRVDIEVDMSPPTQGRFWFVPELGWVPIRWEWGRMEAPENVRWRWVTRLFYGDQVRGVGIPTAGKCAQVANRPPDWEPMIWEAEMLSYKLEPPPEREFTLAAFGIPEPSKVPARSRLWLWTLIGALGTLTSLFLLRLFAAGRREKERNA